MSKEDKLFSVFMKELRLTVGLTIDEAARRIGVGIETIEDWEAGRSLPSELSAQRISNVYRISQQEWLDALKKYLS